MIEMIASIFFSRIGNVLLTELLNLRKEKKEARLREQIRRELENILHASPLLRTMDSDAVIDEIVRRITSGEIPVPSAPQEQWYNEGWVHFQAERYKEALAAFERVLQFAPHFTNAYNSKGDVLYRLERYDDALKAYERALQLEANSVWAWYGKGNVLRDLQQYNEAHTAYQRVTELEPDNAWAWDEKGEVLYHLKRDEEALTVHQQALTLNPRLSRAYCGKGDAFRRLRHYDDALKAYEQAIQLEELQLEDRKAWAWYGKGNIFRDDLNLYEEALLAYQRVIDIDPSNSWARSDYEKTAQLVRKKRR
jgi:tetratricopeptide (TPR) repeat protein